MPPKNQGEAEHPNMPSLKEITDAYSDILKHNSDNTGHIVAMGAIVGAMMDPNTPKDIISGSDLDTDVSDIEASRVVEANLGLIIDNKISQKVTEGDMHASLIDVLHGDMFEHIGITILPLGPVLNTVDNKQASNRELLPRISNTVLYGDFLSKLKPEDVDANETLRRMIQTINLTITKSITDAFSKTMAQIAAETPIEGNLLQAGEDALRTYIQLEPEYERLGVDDSKLKAYVRYWGHDILPEYIKAESGQLLMPPEDQRFGPSDWHLDAGGYPGWEKAVQLVDLLASDSRTKSLSEQIRANLILSIEVALDKLSKRSPESMYDHIRTAKPNLDNALHALEGRNYDPKQLASFSPLSEHRTW